MRRCVVTILSDAIELAQQTKQARAFLIAEKRAIQRRAEPLAERFKANYGPGGQWHHVLNEAPDIANLAQAVCLTIAAGVWEDSVRRAEVLYGKVAVAFVLGSCLQ